MGRGLRRRFSCPGLCHTCTTFQLRARQAERAARTGCASASRIAPVAGRSVPASADRQPCLAWIWDDPEQAPETAPETSEGLGGAAIVSAVGVWVNDDRQFIAMEQPYVGVGADETLGTDPLNPLGLPPMDMAPAD